MPMDEEKPVFYFLPEDLLWLDNEIERIRMLIKQAKVLGQEATEQSSESWHDNYNFEESQRLLKMYFNILGGLSKARECSQVVSIPDDPDEVVVGAAVSFTKCLQGQPGRLERESISIGSYMVSDRLRDADFVSYDSPIGRALLGLRLGGSRLGRVGDKYYEFTVTNLERRPDLKNEPIRLGVEQLADDTE